MRDHTTTGLIEIIEIRGMVPIAQDTFPNSKILDIATDEIRSVIVPSILATNEEWFLTSVTLPYATSVSVPTNAISGALRDIQFVTGNVLTSVPRLSVEDLDNTSVTQNRQGFIIEDATIKFYGQPCDSIILRYYASPGSLVPVEDCARIVSSSYDSMLLITTITTEGNPESWTDDMDVDIVNNKPFYKTLESSLAASFPSTTTVSIPGDVTASFTAGDWISVAGTSPIPQIPQEWLPYLAQAVVSVITEAQGDLEISAKSMERQNNLKKSLLQTVTPRVRGEAKKIVAVKNRR